MTGAVGGSGPRANGTPPPNPGHKASPSPPQRGCEQFTLLFREPCLSLQMEGAGSEHFCIPEQTVGKTFSRGSCGSCGSRRGSNGRPFYSSSLFL